MKTGAFELIDNGEIIPCTRIEFEHKGGGKADFRKSFARLPMNDRKLL